MSQEENDSVVNALTTAAGYYLAKKDEGGKLLVGVLSKLQLEVIRLGGGIDQVQAKKTAIVIPVDNLAAAQAQATGNNYILFVIKSDEVGEPMFAFYDPENPAGIRQLTSAAI